MKLCLICGKETEKPINAFLHHFRLIDSTSFEFFKGNRQTFGLWTAINQCCPILQIKTMISCKGKSLKFPVFWDKES